MPDIAPDGFIYESAGRRIDPQSGQLYTREEDPQFRNYIDYLGYSPERAAEAMGYDPNDQNTWGRWVQGTDKPDTFYKTLGLFLAGAGLGGLGGGYLGTLTGLTGAGAGGAAGGTAAGTTAAATTVPTLGIAGGTALPASLISSTAVPALTAPALVAGGTAAGTTAATTGTASGIGGGGAAATPTLTASTGIPAGTSLPGATTMASPSGGGWLGTLKDVFLGGKGGKAGVGDYIRTGLDVAGDIEKGRAADRAQQNQYAAFDDILAQQRYEKERANAITNANAPAKFSRQVVLGDILANLKPFTYDNKTGAMSGGLGPWVLGENARTSGEALSKSALDRQLSGNPYNLPEIPKPTPRKTGNALDTGLNIAGTIGAGADATRSLSTDTSKPSYLDLLMDYMRTRNGANGGAQTPTTAQTPTRRNAPVIDAGGYTAPADDPYAPIRPRSRRDYT